MRKNYIRARGKGRCGVQIRKRREFEKMSRLIHPSGQPPPLGPSPPFQRKWVKAVGFALIYAPLFNLMRRTTS